MKHRISSKNVFYLVVLLLWLKTYIAQKFVFDVKIESAMQEFILFISPLSSIVLFLGLSLFVKKNRTKALMGMYVFLSIILYANVVYHRFFNDFITLPVLFQTSNMGDLGKSVHELIKGADILFFLDIIVVSGLLIFKKIGNLTQSLNERRVIFLFGISLLILNLVLAEIQRPQLLTRTFDREMLVKNLGAYNYQLYDIFIQSKTKTKKAFAKTSEFAKIENYVKSNNTNQDSKLFGVAKGKNVILISLESTQSFVINNTMDGHVITPFLNDLIKKSYYFDNFYHQTGQGKTSDSEFIVDNSLYPLPSGAVYFTHSQNKYYSLPKILKEQQYYSATFHANDKTFWNRDIMYKNLGYDHYFASEYYDIQEENSVGWGLKDVDFFTQSIPYMKDLPQPFYAKFLTLTNHHPFLLDEEDIMIPEFTSNSGTLNRYFQTARYLDESLKLFFQQLKEAGLYENSIIVMYGDHYGISQNHNKAMSEYLGKEITPFETVQLQRVPFIVHIPGMKGKTIHSSSGQIDVKPTLLHLLGISVDRDIRFGNNLFAKDREELTVLRDGSFITKDFVYTQNTCYDKSTALPTDMTNCQPHMEKAQTDLKYSDEIIYGDLLRFFDKIE